MLEIKENKILSFMVSTMDIDKFYFNMLCRSEKRGYTSFQIKGNYIYFRMRDAWYGDKCTSFAQKAPCIHVEKKYFGVFKNIDFLWRLREFSILAQYQYGATSTPSKCTRYLNKLIKKEQAGRLAYVSIYESHIEIQSFRTDYTCVIPLVGELLVREQDQLITPTDFFSKDFLTK